MKKSTFNASLLVAALAAAACTPGLSSTKAKSGNILSMSVHDNPKLPSVAM